MRNFHPQTLRLIALALVLLATVLFFSSQIDNYFSPRMLNRIATSVAVILPIAIGQAMVVMTRNIDLSIGSVVGIVAYIIGDFLGTHPDLHPVIVVFLAMALGGFLWPRSFNHRNVGHAGPLPHLSRRIFRRPHHHHVKPSQMAGRPAAADAVLHRAD